MPAQRRFEPEPTASSSTTTSSNTSRRRKAGSSSAVKPSESEPCHICGMVLNRPADLKRHLKIHDPEDKKLPCPVEGCEFEARQKSNLDTHIRQHNNEKSFVCTDDVECEFASCHPSSFVRHREDFHGYIPPSRRNSRRSRKSASCHRRSRRRKSVSGNSKSSAPAPLPPADSSSSESILSSDFFPFGETSSSLPPSGMPPSLLFQPRLSFPSSLPWAAEPQINGSHDWIADPSHWHLGAPAQAIGYSTTSAFTSQSESHDWFVPASDPTPIHPSDQYQYDHYTGELQDPRLTGSHDWIADPSHWHLGGVGAPAIGYSTTLALTSQSESHDWFVRASDIPGPIHPSDRDQYQYGHYTDELQNPRLTGSHDWIANPSHWHLGALTIGYSTTGTGTSALTSQSSESHDWFGPDPTPIHPQAHLARSSCYRDQYQYDHYTGELQDPRLTGSQTFTQFTGTGNGSTGTSESALTLAFPNPFFTGNYFADQPQPYQSQRNHIW